MNFTGKSLDLKRSDTSFALGQSQPSFGLLDKLAKMRPPRNVTVFYNPREPATGTLDINIGTVPLFASLFFGALAVHFAGLSIF